MGRLLIVLILCCACVPFAAVAQQLPFEDVVKNLSSSEPNIRLASVRLLRESRYPESLRPLAALVTDPVDAIQLETIAAELSFFVVDGAPVNKSGNLATVTRDPSNAAAVFDEGVLAVWPRPAPAELLASLLQASDDDNNKVRVEAIYAFGSIALPPLDNKLAQSLVKMLSHRDPRVRTAAAQVIGRVGVGEAGDTLIETMNDPEPAVRNAAMRALGVLKDTRAVQALADQLTFYGKGDGAAAALDGLAGIADPSSVPVFKQRLSDKDPILRRAAAEGLGRAGDKASVSALETAAADDPSAMVRAAMSFAIQKLGRNVIARLLEFIESDKLARQVDGYLIELGPVILQALTPQLNDPSPFVRAHGVQVLGVIGTAANVAVLQPLTRDKDATVGRLANEAIQRIGMRHGK